jgi:hypothetical protein
MKLIAPFAPLIIFIYAVRHLRRAPSQGMTLAPRRAMFYDSDGQEWALDIAPDAETSEVNIIWSVIAGMETYATSS